MKNARKATVEARINKKAKGANGSAARTDLNPTDAAPMSLANGGTAPEEKAPDKSSKKGRRPPRTASSADRDKLTCRYCDSGDLAPSFIRRRDARCRACFKQRYGAALRAKTAARQRKVAAGY